MKKLLLLFLAPLLMATQCDEDEDLLPITDYSIQNNTSVTLVFITTTDNEEPIEVNSKLFIGSTIDENNEILPSQTTSFNSVKLYRADAEGTLILAYEQDPINDELWSLVESTNTESEYSLVITDELID